MRRWIWSETSWRAEKNAADLGYHPSAADEGRWVTYLLEQNLGGEPNDAREAYIEYSPYMYSAPGGGNAKKFAELPIRAYHEPDVNWWIDHRRKSYYSMNSLDLAGLIKQFKILGNKNAELITTWQQRAGVKENSSPHTWSYVDNSDLTEWFSRLAAR